MAKREALVFEDIGPREGISRKDARKVEKWMDKMAQSLSEDVEYELIRGIIHDILQALVFDQAEVFGPLPYETEILGLLVKAHKEVVKMGKEPENRMRKWYGPGWDDRMTGLLEKENA